MSKSLFRFKQFSIHQCERVMKINTDGVLLAASVNSFSPKRILDIGTGTGVIALMLAQRFQDAVIDALDSNVEAAKCAERNFRTSPFANRLHSHPTGFEYYHPLHLYDLIVANPPFFINSLKNTDKEMTMARHTQINFFEDLFRKSDSWLAAGGTFQLIWPPALKEMSIQLDLLNHWNLQREIFIRSFKDSPVIRIISIMGREAIPYQCQEFMIYEEVGVYSKAYRDLLQAFFINF